MTRSNQQHDIGIANASGTEIGFMLTRVKGIPSYREVTTKATAQRYATGSIDYGQIDPEEEISIIQSDFRGGYGLEYADSREPKRYSFAHEVDARFRDKVIAAPLLSTATLPGQIGVVQTLTITNADMESTGTWVTDAGTAARSDVQKHAGSYSWLVHQNNVLSQARQDVASGTYASNRYIFCCWVYSETASKARLAINDGVSTTYSSYHTGGSTWERLSVTKLLAAAANKVYLILESAATGAGTAYFDDATIHQAIEGAINSQCDFNSKRYISCGNMLLLKNSGGTALSHVATFPAVITQLYPTSVAGTDYLIICLGWSDAYWYMKTSEVCTETPLSNITAKYFLLVGATFYEADTNSTLRTTTNPLSVAWSTQIQVGDDVHNITCLLEAGGLPYIMKQDKPYYRTSGGTITVLTDETTNLGGTTGGVNSIAWKGSVWMPYGTQGLLQYDISSGEPAWRSPSLAGDVDASVTGNVSALAGDDFYLYAVVHNTVLSYSWAVVMCLIYEDVDGTSSWRWHTLRRTASAGITSVASAGITSIDQKRLWIGSTVSTDVFAGISLTTMYGAIASDTGYAYETSAIDARGLITPWFHCNLRGDKKAFYKLTLTMSGTTANLYWRAYYQKLGDGTTWTEISPTPTFFKTSPQTSAYLPADGSSVNPQSTMMRLRFTPVTNSTTTSPVLLGFDLRAVWYPRQREVIYCQVELADNQPDKLVMDDTSTATRKTLLDELYNPATPWPRAFYPPYYVSSSDIKYVKALPPRDGQMSRWDKDRNPEYIYNLVLQVVPLS